MAIKKQLNRLLACTPGWGWRVLVMGKIGGERPHQRKILKQVRVVSLPSTPRCRECDNCLSGGAPGSTQQDNRATEQSDSLRLGFCCSPASTLLPPWQQHLSSQGLGPWFYCSDVCWISITLGGCTLFSSSSITCLFPLPQM